MTVETKIKRHRWKNGDQCIDCGLKREGAGAGPYGAMRYYYDNLTYYYYKPPPCKTNLSEGKIKP